MTVYTEAISFKADKKLLAFIEEKLSKLERMFDKIIDAKVTLKIDNSGKNDDKVAEVRLNLPGQVLIAKNKQKTFEASIDMIIDNLKRQLSRYKKKIIDSRKS